MSTTWVGLRVPPPKQPLAPFTFRPGIFSMFSNTCFLPSFPDLSFEVLSEGSYCGKGAPPRPHTAVCICLSLPPSIEGASSLFSWKRPQLSQGFPLLSNLSFFPELVIASFLIVSFVPVTDSTPH